MQKISGQEISKELISELKQKPAPQKILAAVLVGSTHSTSSGQASSPQVAQSESFLKIKEKTAKELGVDFRLYKLEPFLRNDGLRDEIYKIAHLERVGGIIVQLPLPEGLNENYILNVIPREKDVDVLGERALGAFYNNRNEVEPPAVGVVREIIRREKLDLKDKKVAVVGLGRLIGKPVAIALMKETPNLYLLRRGSDFGVLKDVDLVISGTGQAGVLNPSILKAGAGVIDFGYNDKDGKLLGDLKTDNPEQLKKLSFYTPVPGGTGPLGVAKLFENFYKLVLG